MRMDDHDQQNKQKQEDGLAGCLGLGVKILAYTLLVVVIFFGLVFGWCAVISHR